MPGPLKGRGKFWNIDPIWGYILLILATNCAFWFSLYFQFDQTFLTPLPLLRKTFWSPPSGNSKLFWPPLHFAQPPPTKVFMNAPLNTFKRMMLKITSLPLSLWPPNDLWPNDYITWDMLGLIDDYCGKIQLNSEVRQSYIIKTKMRLRYWLTL